MPLTCKVADVVVRIVRMCVREETLAAPGMELVAHGARTAADLSRDNR
jgi:hypothetical protein